MKPAIGLSITLTSPDRWSMGSMMECEKVTGSAPADAVTVWTDGDSTYCLRRKPEPITNKLPPPGDSVAGKIHDVSEQLAVYAIGKKTVCKVRSWGVGLGSEAKTLEFMRKNAPSIPVPEPYFYWVDEAWNRSYLLMRRASGQTLENAWKKLTERQQKRVAAELANHVKTLSYFTSPRVESVDGHGLNETDLLLEVEGSDRSLPCWTRRTHPKFTPEQLRSYFLRMDGVEPPSIGEEFYLSHDGLAPDNVLVVNPIPDEENELPLISCIIGWETTGYYPFWWIGTTPAVSFGYDLNRREHAKPEAWRLTFTLHLRYIGFGAEDKWYVQHLNRNLARWGIE